MWLWGAWCSSWDKHCSPSAWCQFRAFWLCWGCSVLLSREAEQHTDPHRDRVLQDLCSSSSAAPRWQPQGYIRMNSFTYRTRKRGVNKGLWSVKAEVMRCLCGISLKLTLRKESMLCHQFWFQAVLREGLCSVQKLMLCSQEKRSVSPNLICKNLFILI